MNTSRIRRTLQRLETLREASAERVDKLESECATLKQKKEAAEKAREILQITAEVVQARVHARIAGLVSSCLASVFDDPYTFEIAFEKKRGKTEARIYFLRQGNEVDPMSGSGGGAVDVAAFALRVACMMLSRPPLRRVMVLDEPFKFVSKEYRDRVRKMIEDLSEELEVQFVQVTHIPELRVGDVIEVK